MSTRQDQPTSPSPGAPSLAATDFANDRASASLGEAFRDYRDRLRGGDMGALPAVLGLVVLFIVFSALRPDSFTSALNIANLLTQASAISVLAMGLVPVLLLGIAMAVSVGEMRIPLGTTLQALSNRLLGTAYAVSRVQEGVIWDYRLARALMAACLDAARHRGAAGLWLGVNQLNERAQRFYGKSGFSRVGTKRFLVGGVYEDDFVMERALDPRL